MKAQFRVTLILDIDYEDDIRDFLYALDDKRYTIEKIESLKLVSKSKGENDGI